MLKNQSSSLAPTSGRFVLKPGAPVIGATETAMVIATEPPLRIAMSHPGFKRALAMLQTGATLEELGRLIPPKDAATLVAALSDRHLLRTAFENSYTGTPHERQVLALADRCDDPNAAQRAIIEAHVAIVGVGGTGCAVLQHFVAAGVQTYDLVDPDCVEVTNFNRQFLWTSSDIGKRKIDVAKEYVVNRSPSAEVNVAARRITTAPDLAAVLNGRRPELIVCCADTPPVTVQKAVTDYCLEVNTACIFAGVGSDSGYVGPLLSQAESLQRYAAYLARIEPRGSVLPILQGSFGPTNTMISARLSAEALLYLAGVRDLDSYDSRLVIRLPSGASRVERQWSAT